MQTAVNLLQQTLPYLLLLLCQLKCAEPLLQPHHGHLHQVGDAPATYLNILSFGLQACAVALRAGGLATVAGHHHAVLYLVLVLPHHIEEGVDARALLLALV